MWESNRISLLRLYKCKARDHKMKNLDKKEKGPAKFPKENIPASQAATRGKEELMSGKTSITNPFVIS